MARKIDNDVFTDDAKRAIMLNMFSMFQEDDAASRAGVYLDAVIAVKEQVLESGRGPIDVRDLPDVPEW